MIDDDSFPTDSFPVSITAGKTEADFDFGATSIGCKPTVIYIALKNAGVVPVDWIFQFLNDLEVDIEHWVDPGDYTEEQISQNFILDNNIFDISPRSGKLKPGEIIRITLSYNHDVAGAHSLPVVFRQTNGASRAGKEVLINFVGYTVPPSQKFLHLQSNNHELQPIKIGTMVAPIQTYHIRNCSTVAFEYKIDTSTIDKVIII